MTPHRIPRRRFIQIAASTVLATPAKAQTVWRGQALGAEATLTLDAPTPLAREITQTVTAELRRIEQLFSLYDPGSVLSHLNRTGLIERPSTTFLELCREADHVFSLSAGRFDPTIQPLWQAYAQGADVAAARAKVGWQRVGFDAQRIRLAPGQALSFNGIAQGFATDRVTKLLRQFGLTRVLVNIGEFRGLGGPWMIGLEDPHLGAISTLQSHDSAFATSSPGALSLGKQAHIIDPTSQTAPQWSTSSVEADRASLADGLSTAFCLMPRAEIVQVLASEPNVHAVHLVDQVGNYRHLRR